MACSVWVYLFCDVWLDPVFEVNICVFLPHGSCIKDPGFPGMCVKDPDCCWHECLVSID